MPWHQPSDYQPRPDLKNHLESISPKMFTAELDMVIYWQWVHRSLPAFTKTPAKAWADLNMTHERARQAIDRKIVPLEIYPQVLERALEPELVA